MSDALFRFFLAFSHGTIIIPLIIIGYLWFDRRRVFFHGTCLLLLSMAFNWALKVTFQIPLSPELGKEGFAFPSGHMQTAFVFYGWLWRSFHNHLPVKIGIPLVLIGIGIGLVHFGYHTYFDVFGGLFFGFLLLYTYSWLLMRLKETTFLITLFLFSTSLMVYSGLVYKIKELTWIAYGVLVFLIFSQYVFKFKKHFP